MDMNQISVPCRDYDASVAFYRCLGLRQIVDSPPRYARFESSSGTTLSIHSTEHGRPSDGIVLYFEVDDVDATVAELRRSGIAVDDEPADQRWLWREAYLRDPFGNRLCIFYAGKNRRFPPWRVEQS